MRQFGRPVWIVTEAHEAGEREARQLFSKVKNHFVRIQREYADPTGQPFPAFWAEVLESQHAVHQNLIGVVPLGRAAHDALTRLKSSRLFGDNIDAKPVTNMDGLVRYLSKEATTQAHYAFNRGFRRLSGSHPLGIGGGDRVRLSRDLEAALIREGRIEPYRKTYASRALPSEGPGLAQTVREPDPHGLFGALPEQSAPPRAHVLPPRPRLKLIHPDQPELKIERLPDAIDLLARLGSTDAEIAAKIGRSRPQTTNIRNRQFGASRQVVRRVLELARAA